jgi:hypothetical protein
MAEFASKGWAALNTVLGSIGTAGTTGILGGLFNNNYACSENMPINRYELNQESAIAKLESENALLKSNVYIDQKSVEAYKDLNGKIGVLETKMFEQDKALAVSNAKIEGTFAVLGEKLNAQHNQFMCALNRERDERCCGDNSIVTYLNATFYPKLVADVTPSTTTTAQPTYNPVYNCGCGCK